MKTLTEVLAMGGNSEPWWLMRPNNHEWKQKK